MRRNRSILVLFGTSLVLAALIASGCSQDRPNLTGPATGANTSGGLRSLSIKNASDVALVMRMQNEHTPELLATHGVIGTGTGLSANGTLSILAITDRAGVRGLPSQISGVAVVPFYVGTVTPYAKPGGGGTLQCGTSTGNDLECAAGTIGCVVVKGGTK